MGNSSRHNRSANGLLPLNQIIHADCVEAMAKLPDESIDMVFADPPYNLQLAKSLKRPDDTPVERPSDEWDHFNTFIEYDQFSQSWLEQVHRLLKPNGTLWVIGSYHNIFRIGTLLQNLGFWILNDIIWHKVNPMPNFKGRRFTNAHETILWCTKGLTTKYTFNYEALKQLNEGLQMRSDWTLPVCRMPERLSDAQGKTLHPTQKPEALLYRMILASTKEDDVILDPFFGTGTSGAVAKKMCRHFIGIEKDDVYIPYATERLDKIQPIANDNWLELSRKKPQKRIPFGILLETGYLKVGQKLFNKKKTVMAEITIDGSLYYEGHKKSIHQMAALAMNKETANGWQYWYYHDQGEDKLIHELRNEYTLTHADH